MRAIARLLRQQQRRLATRMRKPMIRHHQLLLTYPHPLQV